MDLSTTVTISLTMLFDVDCQNQTTTEASLSENQTEESEEPTEQGLPDGVPRQETTVRQPKQEAVSQAEARVKTWVAMFSDELI